LQKKLRQDRKTNVLVSIYLASIASTLDLRIVHILMDPNLSKLKNKIKIVALLSKKSEFYLVWYYTEYKFFLI